MKFLNLLTLHRLLTIIAFVNFFSIGNAQIESKTILPECVTLKAGTLVWLESTERISSDASIGTVVKLRVRSNVTVDGKVVISTGAFALGRVKNKQAATFNTPASLVIVPTYVTTSDGQNVAINGDEQTFMGEFVLQNFVVEQGQQFTATITNNEVVKF